MSPSGQVIELEDEVEFNSAVQPYCVPASPEPLDGLTCTVSGWGSRPNGEALRTSCEELMERRLSLASKSVGLSLAGEGLKIVGYIFELIYSVRSQEGGGDGSSTPDSGVLRFAETVSLDKTKNHWY